MRPRFVSLEGGEGAGKSTQTALLAAALRDRGIETLVTREPGGSAGAEIIRSLLMQGEPGRWTPRAEALLFAAARTDHVARTILPAIDAGRWVICDRFVDSSRAYQGVAQGIDDAEIMALHALGAAILPDRTFILDLPARRGSARAMDRDGAAADRFARRDPGFHQAVEQAFRDLATVERGRIRLIDATLPASEVTEAIVSGLADLLA